MFSKNTPTIAKRQMADLFGVRKADQHDLYLGLPTMVGKSCREVFGCIRDKVFAKLKGWKGKHLSKARKEILIKAVAQAVPSYNMSVFRLSSSLCNKVEAIIRMF